MDAPPPPPDDAPTEADGADAPERSCPNCGATGAGPFCAGCGQRHRDDRLTLRGLWSDFASRAFSLDRGLLHTVVGLASGPGRVPSAYVDGLRRQYTHPLSFYLLTAAVYLFTFGLVQESVVQSLDESGAAVVSIDVSEEEAASDSLTVSQRFGVALRDIDGEDGTGVIRRLALIQRRTTTPLLVFLALFLVAPLRWAFGPRRNLAETTIFTLYVVGAGTLALALLGPALFLVFPPSVAALGQTVLTFAAYPALVAWGALAFWSPGWRTLLKALVATLVALVVYSLASGLVSLVLLVGEVLDAAGLTWGELIRS